MAATRVPSTTAKLLRGIVCIQAYGREFRITQPYLASPVTPSSGTGFLVARDRQQLTFMTAAHVLAHATRFTVRFPQLGTREFDGTHATIMPDYDLACFTVMLPENDPDVTLLRLSVMPLATAPQMVALKPGAAVYAYGFPLGLSNPKVSVGAFNGVERHELQHDAATSPGNSGGPLEHGGVVYGVVSWKMVSHAAEGVQFTMPVTLWTLAEKITTAMPQCVFPLPGGPTGGRVVTRPMYGLCIQAQTDKETMRRLCGSGDGTCSGSRVSSVVPGAAAAAAGVRVGDLITHVNGFRVNSASQVAGVPWAQGNMVAFTEVLFRLATDCGIDTAAACSAQRFGEVRLTLRREGGEQVTVEVRPRLRPAALRKVLAPLEKTPYLILEGLVLLDASANVLQSGRAHALAELPMGQLAKRDYVVVIDVIKGSRASMHGGIAAGQLLQSINNTPIHHVSEVAQMLHSFLKAHKDGMLVVEAGGVDSTFMFTTRCSKVVQFAHKLFAEGTRPANVGAVLDFSA